MECRTIRLRLVVGSRDFYKRREALNTASATAAKMVEASLLGAGFRIIGNAEGEIVDEGLIVE